VRFLTRAWHAGDTPDEDEEAIGAAYRAHRASVLPALPARFRAFAETIDIHDARVRGIHLDRRARTLELSLRSGDLPTGYLDLEVRYLGVDLGSLDTGALEAIGRNPRAEALYHEVDVAGKGWFEHRWLWWPYQDLDVKFRAFDFATEPRPDRAFERADDAYVEIDGPAG
jgi:hypothetical protein